MKKHVKLSFRDFGFAKPEPHRIRRQGFPEAIYCPGKTDDQIHSIFQDLLRGPGPVIATRIDAITAHGLTMEFSEAEYYESARLVIAKPAAQRRGDQISVITGGTADLPVAEEAALTAQALGSRVKRLYDVGVAGLHRLMAHQSVFAKSRAIVVCAGMEGALASVVGGLAACPVIAVPTSVGYGAHFEGVAPLLTMLNSCAANVSVVNIDNGFGAGIIASLIARKSSRS